MVMGKRKRQDVEGWLMEGQEAVEEEEEQRIEKRPVIYNSEYG